MFWGVIIFGMAVIQKTDEQHGAMKRGFEPFLLRDIDTRSDAKTDGPSAK